MKKIFTLTLVVVLTASLLGGCQKAPEETVKESAAKELEPEVEKEVEAELEPLRIATMPFLSNIPIRYMVENKIDEKYGFKAEVIMFPTGAPMNEAIASDQWDVGAMSAAAVYALANYNAYCIGHMVRAEGGMELFTYPDSPIGKVEKYNPTYPELLGSPETVKGATIAVPVGTLAQMHVNLWLEKIGLQAEDVNIVHMEFAQAYQALLSEQCDIASLGDSLTNAAHNEGLVNISKMTDLDAFIHDSIIASPKAFEEKSDLLVKYLKALYESIDVLIANPDIEAQLLHEMYTENGATITLEACQEEVENRPLVGSEESKKTVVGESVMVIADFFASQELITVDKLPIIEALMDDTIIKEALDY